MQQDTHPSPSTTDGQLLAWLVAGCYGLLTLLPDSSTLILSWPWVFIWQVSLAVPVLWLLWQLWQQGRVSALGQGWDWLIGFAVVSLVIATLFAQFPNQARWYAWAALCFVAALYALGSWLNSAQRRYRLLVTQGYLNLAFIVISLGLWASQTLLPELKRLQDLEQYGVQLSYNFAMLELRNWAPLGHQNYVAGYLLLALPLLVGLSLLQTGWQRWLWIAGTGLGVTALYTTSSRGGWLGISVLLLVGAVVLLMQKRGSRPWLSFVVLGSITGLVVLLLTNNRLRATITAVLSGQRIGELAYRLITTATGWHMGSHHLWTGAGPGGVPLLYQQYRPVWAGREAELIYQLHSTPVQLWAEMGLWGLVLSGGAIALFIQTAARILRVSRPSPITMPRSDRILACSLLAGLLAYGIMSLTDYQLDVVAISGTLVIYLACLTSGLREAETGNQQLAPAASWLPRFAALAGLAVLLVVSIWLTPIQRAWQLSSWGFSALNQEEPDVTAFVKNLEQAHQLAPWEPYYPQQLAWKLGHLGLQTPDPQQREVFLDEAIAWFQNSLQVWSDSEFSATNLAWLLLRRDPLAATQVFAQSLEHVPAKRGLFYGLGLSLLAQGEIDRAIEALTLEILRDPLFVTSPLWQVPQLQPVYPSVLSRVEASYTAFLQQDSASDALKNCWHQSRGGLRWWRGDVEGARVDWERGGTTLSRLILDLAAGKSVQSQLGQLPSSPAALVVRAWFEPLQRPALLQRAWIQATQTAPPEPILPELLTGMASATTFDQWLKYQAPTWEYQRQRAGFGVNSRHIDGLQPTDFWLVAENVAMTTWFEQLFPSPVYNPELDLALQPQREALLQSVSADLGVLYKRFRPD